MSAFAVEVGARLRAVRHAQGMSLAKVERLSNGELRGMTLASYERADRAVTVEKLDRIARFYRVPLTDLLPDCRDEVVSELNEALESVRRAVALLDETYGGLS